MLSANQINAQVKLTEMWKAQYLDNYPIKGDKQTTNEENRSTRSTTRGDLIIHGNSEISRSAFINDASKMWNNVPVLIKQCKTLYSAKKQIKKFVTTLPL